MFHSSRVKINIISVAFFTYNAILLALKNANSFSLAKCKSDVIKNPTSSSFKQKLIYKPLWALKASLMGVSLSSLWYLKQSGWLFKNLKIIFFTFYDCLMILWFFWILWNVYMCFINFFLIVLILITNSYCFNFNKS